MAYFAQKSHIKIRPVEVGKVDMQLWVVVAKRGGYVENSFNKSYCALSNELNELIELEPFFPLLGLSNQQLVISITLYPTGRILIKRRVLPYS